MFAPLLKGSITGKSPGKDQVCFPLTHPTSLHLGMDDSEAGPVSNGIVNVPCKEDADIDESIASKGAGYESYITQ